MRVAGQEDLIERDSYVILGRRRTRGRSRPCRWASTFFLGCTESFEPGMTTCVSWVSQESLLAMTALSCREALPMSSVMPEHILQANLVERMTGASILRR